MGRHRRSAAAPAPEDRSTDRSTGAAGRLRGGARRKKRAIVPVRTGLLGVSAAMAVGAVAVASGLLPGGDTLQVSGGPGAGGQVRADAATSDPQTQGGRSSAPADGAVALPGQGTKRVHTPSASPTPTAGKPSAKPSEKAEPKAGEKVEEKAGKSASPEATGESESAERAKERAGRTEAPAVSRDRTPASESAEAAVLALVNQERAKVGCQAVRPSAELAALAAAFSKDMAERDFFDHTDPDGATPWDRAEKAGVKGLGGENIARGQADAQAVMDAWMNSEGHRANILNCDYKTLGVGVHFGAGGPWWTQDFGF
ncbi:CAP domain-containing protein [Streptomyces sp. NPDC050504]|uniref:CAP domain-containing protein n=1 Tax=Streptomyces sp. NPDC050504 TaxID=3365618 RepID=UPI0037A97DDB